MTVLVRRTLLGQVKLRVCRLVLTEDPATASYRNTLQETARENEVHLCRNHLAHTRHGCNQEVVPSGLLFQSLHRLMVPSALVDPCVQGPFLSHPHSYLEEAAHAKVPDNLLDHIRLCHLCHSRLDLDC